MPGGRVNGPFQHTEKTSFKNERVIARPLLNPLIKPLAIRLSRQITATKSLVIPLAGEEANERYANLRYSALSSVSPVRMRMTCSTDVTKILPSPILPV